MRAYFVTQLTQQYVYTIAKDDGPIRLSCDCMPGTADLAPGTCMHADLWEGWEPAVLDRFQALCINKRKSCVDGELGDGTMISTRCAPCSPTLNWLISQYGRLSSPWRTRRGGRPSASVRAQPLARNCQQGYKQFLDLAVLPWAASFQGSGAVRLMNAFEYHPASDVEAKRSAQLNLGGAVSVLSMALRRVPSTSANGCYVSLRCAHSAFISAGDHARTRRIFQIRLIQQDADLG